MRLLLFISIISIFVVKMFAIGELGDKAITYETGSRTGDLVLDYIHAKWLSYRYNIPLLFKPFEYSEHFIFHEVETNLYEDYKSCFTEKIITDVSQIEKIVNDPTLFVVQHFPDNYEEYLISNWSTPFVFVDWEDKNFRKMMRELIQPRDSLNILYPKFGVPSVALHYRTGLGIDSDSCRKLYPLRFLPDKYYIQQIKELHKIISYGDMHVHIFTDHPSPTLIKQILESIFPPSILFTCREMNFHNQNVLEDLFSMVEFDCLIRPHSHFSTLASHIGNFKVEITPDQYRGNNSFLVKIKQNYRWNPRLQSWQQLAKQKILTKTNF